MALPPIISNLPFLKLFKSADRDHDVRAGGKQPDKKSAGPRDTVEISHAALQKSAGDSDQARETAVQTRQLLEKNGDVALGLDPAFS